MKLITYLTLFVSVWDNLNDTTFKQGGATQHYELIVREWLQEVFPEKWIVELAHITGLHELLNSPRVTFFL